MDEVVPLVGDRDRRLVDEQLQSAVGDGVLTLGEYDERAALVWRARTRADLDAVTRDLPLAAPAPVPAVPAGAGGSVRLPEERRVVAVLSGDRLSGPVAPGQGVTAYAVLGNAEIDLRREDLPADLQLRAVSVLGNVEVLVPRGVSVEVRGASVLGSRDVSVEPARPGGTVVHLDARAVLGSVQVHHGDQAASPGSDGSVSLRKDAVPAVPGSAPARRRRHRHGWGRVVVPLALAVGLAVGVPAAVTADQRSVFGSGQTQVGPGQSVDVAVLFGSYEVVVPDDAAVDLNGTMVFGSSACKDGCTPPGAAGTDVVHVHARGAFGSVEVVRRSQADRGD